MEETLFPSLVARRRRVLGHRFEGHWADLGTPQRYLDLNRELLGGRNAIARGAQIDAGAVVAGTAVGAGCRVDEDARVIDSILWEGVEVGAGATVERCILADGVVVGSGARAEGVVAGEGSYIGTGAVAPPGTLMEAGGRYDGTHG